MPATAGLCLTLRVVLFDNVLFVLLRKTGSFPHYHSRHVATMQNRAV
jgi:hypothetical protein